MKKTFILSAIAIALGAASAFAHCGNCPGDKKEPAKTQAAPAKKNCGGCPGHKKAEEARAKGKNCGDCPMHKKQGAKKCGGMTCPEKIKGAETVSRNIENGVEVITTAADKETAARIQELALVHYGPKADRCQGCPTTVPGAETRAVNIENGIKVTITGKTPETVRKIQEASAREHAGGHAAEMKGPARARAAQQAKKEAMSRKKYSCVMNCVEADKPGSCPKCGMPMEEKK